MSLKKISLNILLGVILVLSTMNQAIAFDFGVHSDGNGGWQDTEGNDLGLSDSDMGDMMGVGGFNGGGQTSLSVAQRLALQINIQRQAKAVSQIERTLQELKDLEAEVQASAAAARAIADREATVVNMNDSRMKDGFASTMASMVSSFENALEDAKSYGLKSEQAKEAFSSAKAYADELGYEAETAERFGVTPDEAIGFAQDRVNFSGSAFGVFGHFFGTVDLGLDTEDSITLLNEPEFLNSYVNRYKESLLVDNFTAYALAKVTIHLGSETTPTMFDLDQMVLVVSKRDLLKYGVAALDQELIHAGIMIAHKNALITDADYSRIQNLNKERFSHLDGYVGTCQNYFGKIGLNNTLGTQKAFVIGYQFSKYYWRKWAVRSFDKDGKKIFDDIVAYQKALMDNEKIATFTDGKALHILDSDLTPQERGRFIFEFVDRRGVSRKIVNAILEKMPQNNIQFDSDIRSVLVGLPGQDDSLYGLDGNDQINGYSGHDEIYGGRGIDTIRGGLGNDDLYGGNDNDTLYGEDGRDIVSGGRGHDKLFGGNGDDQLYGGPGRDVLKGGSGNDFIVGGDDIDTVDAGPGNDVIIGQWMDKIATGAGGDRVRLPMIVGRSMTIEDSHIEFSDRLIVNGVSALTPYHCVRAKNGVDLICPRTTCSCIGLVCGGTILETRRSCSSGQGGRVSFFKVCTANGWVKQRKESCDGNVNTGGD